MKLYKEKKKKYYRKKQQYSESSEVFDTSADEDSLNSEQDHDDSNREGNKKKLLLELMYDKNYRPMKFRELCVLLDVSKARRYELETALNQLVDEGKYGKPELFTLKGSFSSTSRGFGFVTVEEKDNDIFIAPDNTLGALPGDVVLVSVISHANGSRREEGRIVRILEHTLTSVVGTFQIISAFFVISLLKRERIWMHKMETRLLLQYLTMEMSIKIHRLKSLKFLVQRMNLVLMC